MNKNIIFCADGTWDSPDRDSNHDGEPDATNVWRLYSDIAGTALPADPNKPNEYEKTLTDADGHVVQVARYLHGVGNANNWLLRILGGVFGAGMICHIVRGYLFICRCYQPGDRIYLTGFSRGAYTARALAGMIDKCGLLDAGKIDLQENQTSLRLGMAVWIAYRQASGIKPPLISRLLQSLPNFFHQRIDPGLMLTGIAIEAVTVWETVGALGIPRYQGDKRLDLYRFADTRLADSVRYGRQAIAIDEQRLDFTPVCWRARRGITQVLFPGIHTDVGGGYPTEDGSSDLSTISYRWLRDELVGFGVRIARTPRPEDPLGPIHCEWKKGSLWLTGPRRLNDPVSAEMMLHQSAAARLASAQPSPVEQPDGRWQNELYRPAALKAFTAPDWQLPARTVIAE